MGGADDLYKRKEDSDWRKKVDHEQVTLMTGYQVLSDKLDELREQVQDHNATIHGEKGSVGLVSEYARHDDQLTRLNAVVFQDASGHKGLMHDIDTLMGRKRSSDDVAKSREERAMARSGWFWAFITTVVAALITGVLTNLDKIEPVVAKVQARWQHAAQPAPKKKGGRGKAKRRIPPIEQPAPLPPQPDPPKE